MSKANLNRAFTIAHDSGLKAKLYATVKAKNPGAAERADYHARVAAHYALLALKALGA